MLQKRKVTGSDQVSRILHTKNCMRIYLGGLAKQQHAPPPPPPPLSDAVASHHKVRLSPPAERDVASFDASVLGSSPRRSASSATLHHSSFTSKVEDTDVWLRCATCARECCSTDVEYMYLPNLSKPWVPLCHGCCA